MAFEVVEQLGWQAPDHLVIPAAGGTLSSRVHKGLNELETVGLAETAGLEDQHRPGQRLLADRDRDPRRRRARAAEAGDRRPLAGDRRARRRRPGDRRGSHPRRLAAAPSDPEIFEAIDLLGATEGILTEPAGGTTIAATARLAAGGQDRSRGNRRRGDQRQRPEDALRAPGQALAGNGRLRGRHDGRGARRLPPGGRGRAALSGRGAVDRRDPGAQPVTAPNPQLGRSSRLAGQPRTGEE